MYDLESRLIAELSGEGTVLREYIWLENEPLALREYELRPGLYFYINDHLATPPQLVDSQGTVVWQSAALPFGQSQVLVGTVQNNLRFPGQCYDAETGLHYNWNRYYDPDTGRYLSPDPIGLEGGPNLYAYVGNDPVNWMDKEGFCRKRGETKYQCANRVAREVLGDRLDVVDNFGYYGIGAWGTSTVLGNHFGQKFILNSAKNKLKNLNIEGAMTDGDILRKLSASRRAGKRAEKIIAKRNLLATLSKFSGISGAAATVTSFAYRGMGYYFGDCEELCCE